jgi:SNF2 family DNA or RNA helicase
MDTGKRVRLKADPGRTGVLTGNKSPRGNYLYWQVMFTDGSEYHREELLEVVVDENEDPMELLRRRSFGRARDLRGNLTFLRLNGRLADLIYSMNTTNTDFYAYQFKPVLSFLDSPNNSLLIADEVGLGKTIEAGLIMTELRSRFDIRRIMILCPSHLQDKWALEMNNKFGINTEICKPAQVLDKLKSVKSGDQPEFTIICSLQGMRPRKGWEDDKRNQDAASKLARFIDENQYEETLIDLMVIDEAHYLRNPKSMTADLARIIRPIADNFIMLSATPIHLKSKDLYHLLKLVDEDTFNQPAIFDEILKANGPIIKAIEDLTNKELTADRYITLIQEAMGHSFLEDNRQLTCLLQKPPTDIELMDENYKAKLANKLENINLLGRVITRTRKRDVNEWRVIREPVSEMVDMSEPEKNFYIKVTLLVREYAETLARPEGFLLVMPQRQMSSCMPAAFKEWKRRNLSTTREDALEDIGVEVEDIGPLVRFISERVDNFGNYDDLYNNDTKYHRFREMLIKYLNNNPKDKIVLFSYFKPTLYYLAERLKIDKVNCIVLTGGVAQKTETINEFRDNPRYRVLLTSEVASEGVDLQFSRLLINYDLPWNPMKVEQRIGRLDRIGQLSNSITIWNLLYSGTIDARIHDRLYLRLDIFRKALGGMEEIVSREIKKLTNDLLFGKFTSEQEEARIDQTKQAIANNFEREVKLEEDANNLVAHGEYILDKVRAAKELERCITNEDLYSFVQDYFNMYETGTEIIQKKPDELIFDIKLSDKTIFELDNFIRNNDISYRTKLVSSGSPVSCLFKNKVEPHKKNIEQINQFHPLIRFVSRQITDKNIKFHSPISVQIDGDKVKGVKQGVYAFWAKLWSFRGVRHFERLCCVVKQTSGSSLSDDAAEKLVSSASRYGEDWHSPEDEISIDIIENNITQCLNRAEKMYDDTIKDIEAENNDRADIQEKSLKQHVDKQMLKLHTILAKHEAYGRINLMKATMGRIENLSKRMDLKLNDINSKRLLTRLSKDICMGIVKVR